MSKLSLTDSVSSLNGVGPTREKQLSKLGIYTLEDLLYFFPRAYERRGNISLLSDIQSDSSVSVLLTVASEVKSATLRRGLTISKFRAFDESGVCEMVFFNTPFVKDVFHIGDEFRFFGKATVSRKKIQFTNPKYEQILPDKELPPLTPVYPLTDGLSSKFIDKLLENFINEALSGIVDPLPDDIRIKNSLPVLSYALRNVHFPESEEALSKSLKRLAFDELFMFGIGVSLSSRVNRAANGVPFSPCDLTPLTSLLPYELTSSQKNAVNDIYKDTVFKDKDGKICPMARIIAGDVGTGKTICATIAIYIAVKSGYQAALMAPTEILSRQHYGDIQKLLGALGIKTELLLGSTSQKEKKRIYSDLANGNADVVIGTHALISDKVEFLNLGLVITDEQHRFGVSQRARLKDKAKTAHLLVMSATPIPRTLALTMYGDLDVSRITEFPKGRLRVDTYVVNESYRERLNTFISKVVENGGQCYIVCPAIQATEDDGDFFTPASIKNPFDVDSEKSNIKNAVEYTENLRQKLTNLRIECLHGKMKAFEKDEVMKKFVDGEIDVLVSTTVIEVGVNVPNASLMIIENAERFGLSQLHQLRGRVGRGTRKSYCVLVSDSTTDKAIERLEIMKSTYDGYEIAERDLMMRGPGDFFATGQDSDLRQSGGFDFKIAKICDDGELVTNAFAAAKEIIEKDPALTLPENEELRRTVQRCITPKSSIIS